MYRGPEPAPRRRAICGQRLSPNHGCPDARKRLRPSAARARARSSGMPECYQQGPTLLSGTGNSPGARTAPTGCSRFDRHRMRGWRVVHPDTMISVS
jgi:hypothetical protein